MKFPCRCHGLGTVVTMVMMGSIFLCSSTTANQPTTSAPTIAPSTSPTSPQKHTNTSKKHPTYVECDNEKCDPFASEPCSCRRSSPPRGIILDETPQMVLFTYTGTMDTSLYANIVDMFPSTLRNPIHYCPVAITLFATLKKINPCVAHRLYAMGHEIGVGGLSTSSRRRDWDVKEWKEKLKYQREILVNDSFIPSQMINGFRGPHIDARGDKMYSAVNSEGFTYDSTMYGILDADIRKYNPSWPYTLNYPPINRCGPASICPKKGYASLWEMPITRLSVDGDFEGLRGCVYVDDCIRMMKNSFQVYRFLYRNYMQHYLTTRAPIQINFKESTLNNKMAVDGIKHFVRVITNSKKESMNTWVVTMMDAIQWIRYPVGLSKMEGTTFWTCDVERKYFKCDINNSTRDAKVTIKLISYMDVSSIWWIQIILLVIWYFALKRSERLKYN